MQRLQTSTEKLQQKKETMEASMMASNNETQANDVLTSMPVGNSLRPCEVP